MSSPVSGLRKRFGVGRHQLHQDLPDGNGGGFVRATSSSNHEYKVLKPIRTHELVAVDLGLERSVYFDLKAGRKVSEETYIKAALRLGCSPDDLKP